MNGIALKSIVSTLSLKQMLPNKGMKTNLANRTLEYGPQNWPITACALTERYNKV